MNGTKRNGGPTFRSTESTSLECTRFLPARLLPSGMTGLTTAKTGVTLGLLSGRVVVISHTETDEVIRIISVRKATKNEEISYFREIAD
jgi:hypothetical protein